MSIASRPPYMTLVRTLALAAALVLSVALAAAAPAPGAEPHCASCPAASSAAYDDALPAGQWIVAFPAANEQALRDQGVAIWDREQDFVIGGAGDKALENLAALKIEPVFKTADRGELVYILSREPGFAPMPGAATAAFTISPNADLYLFPSEQSFTLPRVRPHGAFRGVPRVALPPIEMHPADARLFESGKDGSGGEASSSLTVNPLVTQIVNNTSQANWFQYVKDLSGENTVVIGGNTFTISTRFSDSMFPVLAANAHATEYLEDKGAGWGYSSVRQNYATADSGCTQLGHVWQNLVFTLPGQIDYGQHQQVLFVTHYDSLSFSTAESRNYAPGADDAISGGSALIEALRLFKDYGFKNTIKIIFFSGEEQGLCGSVAYTRQAQNNMADVWRVINMDQTAYDADKNGVMNCYNWDAVNSPQSVALGDSYVQANSDYGPIIAPANIYRPTNKMCQTDHCPFWNVGRAAIAILEDYSHGDDCPCFDQTQTTTCHDTVTQLDPNHPAQLMFDPNYSWPSEKNAIATIAALAEPLYACPASAPTLNATPGNHAVSLNWTSAAGVTNYVVERAATCAGPFTGVTSAAGLTYNDTGLTNGTSYAYRVRTCPNQVSACVSATPNGPSVVYQGGSAVVTADSGDHDNIPDNCELVTVRVNVVNDGNAPLTGVKLSAASSTHPGVQVATAIPQSAGSLGIGASAPVSFKFYLGRNGNAASCGQSLPFTITTSSDQSAGNVSNFSLTAENDNVGGTLSYGFESDFSGWTVTTGTFTRVAGGAPGSLLTSVHSRNVNNGCDAIASPTVTPSASSVMTMAVNYSIEGNGSSTNIWDRAVVRAINTLTGVKTLLVPTGAVYTTTGHGSGLVLCDNIDQLNGWAGSATTWNTATFDLSPYSGVPIQIEVRFGTDGSALGTQGFWFDNVVITNAVQATCDAQSNTCSALPSEVSPNASPVQFTIAKSGPNYNLRFSEVSGATGYNIYGGTLQSLHGGVYDHASSGGICSLIDGSPGDGQVLASTPASGFPNNSYLLVAARNGAGESIYGLTSTNATIPLALASCP